jgi:nitrite reductase (NADH) large subunit
VTVSRVVVVGHGPTSHRLVEALVDKGFDGRITVLGEEPRAAYDRVALTSYLAGRSAADLTYPVPEGVVLRLSSRVVEIDRTNRTVVTADGHAEPYDVLVLATGSSPFVPPVPGRDAEGCFVYRTIDDLDAIRPPGGPRPASSSAAGCWGWRPPTRCAGLACRPTSWRWAAG